MKLTTVFTIVKIFTSLSIANTYFGEKNVSERITDITKPPHDELSYRGLRLSNELKVLLINDPSAKESTSMVSLVAGVGAANDFVGVQGLSNLVAYALMLGSQTYPEGMLRYLTATSCGGLNLPTTKEHEQTFTFYINPKCLKAALKRFVMCFREPLFMSTRGDTVLKEAIHRLEAEFNTHIILDRDESRIRQVEKTLCKPKNVFGNPYTGNRETLFQRIPDERALLERMKTFYKTWYSSNTMTVVIFAKEDLDELERFVVPLFSTIENKKVIKFRITGKSHPYGPEQLGYKIFVVPEQEKHTLYLKFPVPDFTDKYRTAPHLFIGDLIIRDEDEPGSLAFELKKSGLSTNVEFHVTCSVGLAFIVIKSSLTINGVYNVNAVIHLIFQYIHLIREEGIQKTIFDNFRFKRYTRFHNGEPTYLLSENLSLASLEKLAMTMQTYPINMKDILSHEFIIDQWNPSHIKLYLEYLTPQNMNVTIATKVLEGMTGRREKHYGTFYEIKKISEELLSEWSTREFIPDLKLPIPNKYVPENYNVYPIDPNEQAEQPYPYLLYKSLKTEFWFKQDDVYRDPMLFVAFEIHSTLPRLSPHMQMLWFMVLQQIDNLLEQIFYPAKQVGFRWEFRIEYGKIAVGLNGFSDKLPTLLELLLSNMIDFKMDTDVQNINMLIEDDMDVLENILKDSLSQATWYSTVATLSEVGFRYNANLAKQLQPHDFKKFQRRLFQRIFIRGLIHGNCTKQKAMDIVNIIEKIFNSSKGLLLQEMMPQRNAEISEGLHYVYQVFGESYNTFAYSLDFQLSYAPFDLFSYGAAFLFYDFIRATCRKFVSDLAHDASSRSSAGCSLKRIGHAVHNFTVEIESRRDPLYVESALQQFLHDAYISLNNMSRSEFNRLKSNSKISLERPFPRLQDLANYYFFEIQDGYYIFNRIQMLLNLLHSMKKEDLLAFYKDFLLESSARRRRFSVHVFPKYLKNTVSRLFLKQPQQAIKIEDLQDFSNSCTQIANIFARQLPMQWATENEGKSSRSSFRNNSFEGIANESIQMPQQSQQSDQNIEENLAKIAESGLVQTTLENVTEYKEPKKEVFLFKMTHQAETSSENFAKYMEQRRKRHAQVTCKPQESSEEEVPHQPVHKIQTLPGLAEFGDHVDKSIQKVEENENAEQEETLPPQLSRVESLTSIVDLEEESPEAASKPTDKEEENDYHFQILPTDQTCEEKSGLAVEQKGWIKPSYERLEKISELDENFSLPILSETARALTEYPETDEEEEKLLSQTQIEPENLHLVQEEKFSTVQTLVENMPEMAQQQEFLTSKVIPDGTWSETSPKDRGIHQVWKNEGDDPQILLLDESIDAESSFIYPEDNDSDPAEPHIFHESSISEFWFKQTTEFQPPTLSVSLDIFCPISRLHPSNYMLFSILAFLLKTVTNTKVRGTTSYGDDNAMNFRMHMHFANLSERMPTILEKFRSFISEIGDVVDEELFTYAKRNHINYWIIFNSGMGSSHMDWYLKNIMHQHAWTASDLLAAAKTLRFDDWKKFLRKFFSRVFIRGLIIGNSNKENARKIVDLIERPFKSSLGLLPQEISSMRTVQLQKGSQYTYIFNVEPYAYEYWAYFQFDLKSPFHGITSVMSLLLKFIIDRTESHENQIRNTEEGITVRINCKILTEDIVGGFLLVLDTTSKQSITYAKMDALAENYLQNFHNLLRNLSARQFDDHRKTLQDELSMKATNMTELVNIFWKEISEQKFNFERKEVMIDELYFMSVKDIVEFFEEMLAKSSGKRRKLAMYSFPEMRKQDVLSETPIGAAEIVDLTTFKTSSNLLPVNTPYIEMDLLAV